MPKSFPASLRLLWLPCALALLGCFGAEPDDSPYTVHRGEAFEALQLEIEPDGTPIILAQVGMYMSHKDPVGSGENGVWPHNFRSILLRRAAGGWSATAFKNLQPDQNTFPTLIPDAEGRFQAFLSDGGEIKRYVFGNGMWNRAAGTDWPDWLWSGGMRFGAQNWNRQPRIAVAGTDLLLTLHNDWDGRYWVMEGKDRRVTLESGNLSPVAFHAGAGFRSLVSINHEYMGNPGVADSLPGLLYHRWAEGAAKAEKHVLPGTGARVETFFARRKGGTALFVSTHTAVHVLSLDDSGRVAARDSVAFPKVNREPGPSPMIAPDPEGCMHGLAWLPDQEGPAIRYVHWNACAPEAVDTLHVPKPDTSKPYLGYDVKFRVAPDGTPVAALILKQTRPFASLEETRVEPSFLFAAEYRAGVWRLEKVDERHPQAPAAKTAGEESGL